MAQWRMRRDRSEPFDFGMHRTPESCVSGTGVRRQSVLVPGVFRTPLCLMGMRCGQVY